MIKILKLGEKVIYELSDGFILKGINKYNNNGKVMHITNLGNIIICDKGHISDDKTVKYVYRYSEYKTKLSANVDSGVVHVEEREMPFKIVSEKSEKEDIADLVINMYINEYTEICKNQKDFIFEIDGDNSFFVIDGKRFFSGKIETEEEKFIFTGGKNIFEINYNDIEKCSIENNILTLNGYFYMDREYVIVREIQIIANNISRIIPMGFEDMVLKNPKVGEIPGNSDIIFGKISGNINGYDYNSSNILFIKDRESDEVTIINKVTKRTILTSDFYKWKKMPHIVDNIIYDGESIFRLYLNDSNSGLINIDGLKNIDDENIGFTKSGNPFFVEADNDSIRLKKSAEKEIISINSRVISDIKEIKNLESRTYVIDEDEKILFDGYSMIDILFGNEYIEVYLKKSMLTKILKIVFLNSKLELVKNMDMSEVYKNWSKSMNDMIIYNFFADLFIMYKKMETVKSNRKKTDEILINLVNEFYQDIQNQKRNLDILAMYMPEVIEATSENLFVKYGFSFDIKIYRAFEEIFTDISYAIKDELRDIESIITNLSFVISPEERRRHIYRMLKESESDRLSLFFGSISEKIRHIVENMYPYLIRNMEENLQSIFVLLEREYKKCDAQEVKDILFSKIIEMYSFKQDTYDPDSEVRRGDIIDEIHKVSYEYRVPIDSKKFFVGGEN